MLPEPEETEEERLEMMSHYIEQLYIILKPVIICIILSVVWVKLANPAEPYFATGIATRAAPSLGNSIGSVGGESDNFSFIIAGIIMAQIVVSTVGMACLMYYGKIKVEKY
jgi:presenilin 1